MKKLDEYFIKSINEYNDILSEIENKKLYEVFYRGQTDDYSLLPSIGRSISFDENKELELFLEFKRLNKLYREINTTVEWDLLAIAQHYGLKTRLLDWTINPLNALWFAANSNPHVKYSGKYCVVWILASVIYDKDFYFDQERKVIFTNDHTLLFKPNYQAIRIRSQQGLFTVHSLRKEISLKTKSKYLAIEEDRFLMDSPNFEIIKILFNREQYSKEIISKLNTFGINEATIYPELEGLCHHLNWNIIQ
jgi:hypothetical protein